VLHQVKQPPGGWRHDGYGTGEGLLGGLTERLVRPGVHEDVKAGKGRRELVAGLQPREVSLGQLALELPTLRAITDDE